MIPESAFRARTIRQAMQRPDRYLAAVLAEWPDEDLAYAIGALPGEVWKLRLAGYPSTRRWATNIQQLADLVDAIPLELERLLWQLGVRP
jgi:hypothetical protein